MTYANSFVSIVWAVVLLTLVQLQLGCLIQVTAVSDASPLPNYPTILSTIFEMQLSTPLFNQTNPSPIDQTIQGLNVSYAPSPWAGTVPLTNRSDFMVTFSVMLPHKDDDPTGCPTNGDWHTTNEFNQSFANSFVLIMKSSASCITQFLNANKAGMLGLLEYGCPAEAPYNCDPNLQAVATLVSGTHLTVPLIAIKAADGQTMVEYLKAKKAAAVAAGNVPPVDTLTFTMKTTGPMVPEERAALVAIMNQTTMTDLGNYYVCDLPPWSLARFQDPNLDPCIDRPFGLWCEGGHVVYIDVMYHTWLPVIPAEFGLFTKLRYFGAPTNVFSGPLPNSICAWTELRGLVFPTQFSASGITSIPNCDWPLLEELQFYQNGLTSLPPKFSNWTNLKYVYGSNNQLTSLPPLDKLVNLKVLDMGSNSISGAFPSFSPLAPLQVISLSGNNFSGLIPTNAFDGLNQLTILDLNTNHFIGPLPNLIGCVSLQIIDLSNQRSLTEPSLSGGFNGSQPTWTDLQKVTKLSLQANSLISPFYTSQMVSLVDLDLSHNYLTASFGGIGAVPVTIQFLVGPSLLSLRLSYNSFTGPWSSTDTTWFQTIKKLYIDHNSLTAVMPELLQTSLTTIDFSYNNISLDNPTVADFTIYQPGPDVTLLNLQGNPHLQYATLPSWILPTTDKIQQENTTFSCHTFKATTAPGLILQVDPTFHKYHYCDCQSGTFGQPPLCSHVPNYAELNPFAAISSPEIGADYATLIEQTGGLGTQPQSFSDSMYGQNRLTLGISTSWFIDLTNLYADDVDAYIAIGSTPPSPISTYQIDPTVTAPSSLMTPVRVTTIRLHVSATVMNQFEDVLSVYQGGSDLKGTRVFTIRGTDPKPAISSSDFTTTSEYLSLYNASISKIEDPRLIEVQVFSAQSTIQFTSRAVSGDHFYATYSYAFTCPFGYFWDTVTDSNSPVCRANYEVFAVGEGIRNAVFAVSAIALGFVTFNIVILVTWFQALVYKAASRWFLLLILCLLECMALGALLYAAIPSQMNSVGHAICQGRAWLICLPLAGILAVLLAKNNRLDHIFGSTKLSVKVQTDLDILKTVVGVCAIQIILLAVFSGLPLSQPKLVLGHGSQSDELVYQCSQETGFMAWFGVEVAFIVSLMLAAAYLGFRTRDLPSQYNESAHIQNAVILLMFFCVIIIPLDIFIQDSPEAAVLIQGLGQAFLCLTITGILFGPKIFHIFRALLNLKNNKVEPLVGLSEGGTTATFAHESSAPTKSTNGGTVAIGARDAIPSKSRDATPSPAPSRPLMHVKTTEGGGGGSGTNGTSTPTPPMTGRLINNKQKPPLPAHLAATMAGRPPLLQTKPSSPSRVVGGGGQITAAEGRYVVTPSTTVNTPDAPTRHMTPLNTQPTSSESSLNHTITSSDSDSPGPSPSPSP